MKRRGFFGTLAGLALAPFGLKAAKPMTYKGVPIVWVPYMQEDGPEPLYVRDWPEGMSELHVRIVENQCALREDMIRWGVSTS